MTGINKQETSFQVHKMMVGYCGAWSTSILQIYIYRLNYLKLVRDKLLIISFRLSKFNISEGGRTNS